MTEWSVGLAVVAEPYKVPNDPRWYGSIGDSVAIVWGGGQNVPHCSILEKGPGFVTVEWGDLVIIGCYISPNSGLSSYEAYLDELAVCCRKFMSRPLIILGDFNAHSRVWGNKRDDQRGNIIQEWAAELNLQLLNQGTISTCVRWQGESIVDLTWATPSALNMISGWRVAEEVVTLSDHRHIIFTVTQRPSGSSESQHIVSPRRWSVKRLNRDLLEAAAYVASWPGETHIGTSDPESEAIWFRDTMISACNISMPRAGQANKRSVYWWSEDIAQLRKVCLKARRQYTRSRRRRRSTNEEITLAYSAYRDATKALQAAILKAKTKCWKELLEGLDRDPWGRPYKTVLGKLRPSVPPLTQTLDPILVGKVVDTLFPVVQESTSTPTAPLNCTIWFRELEVSEDELSRIIRCLASRNTAPGPDGIPGRAWVVALKILGDRMKKLLTSCLQSGVFPAGWKKARLILIKKEGRELSSPSAYRPICLLDEGGKMLERIIAGRLNDHLSHAGPDLSDRQFGFRKGRSTVDAILQVRSISEDATSRGRVVMAVSLDIINAFNSLPWTAIREALAYHKVPQYLRDIIGAYLSDRSIEYTSRDGLMTTRKVTCGVPQGSVLGPLLWNLAYDKVLRVALPTGASIVCYADDTMILTEGDTFTETMRLAQIAIAMVVDTIHGLGLRIAPHKTEAIWFHRLTRRLEPSGFTIVVGDASIKVTQFLKYLGLILDSRWTFEEHFNCLVTKTQKVANAMHRLLPNLGGPQEGVRRLYASVIRSIALYGAPIWSRRLASVQRLRAKLNGAQRKMAIRVARGYRTISFEAATLLARFPPLDILAEMDATIYLQSRAIRHSDGERFNMETLRRLAYRKALVEWRARLQEERSTRQRVVCAILPSFDGWLERKFGNVTFRLTQILTGHGCFGEYLCRIGREMTPQCHHCGQAIDSAQHTLEVCPAWEQDRHILMSYIGNDLSAAAIVAAMLGEEESWKAVVSFCEAVMLKKEAAERNREKQRGGRQSSNVN